MPSDVCHSPRTPSPFSVKLALVPNISISRASLFPLPRMPRPRSHLPQLGLRGCEREVVATHNDTDVSLGMVEYRCTLGTRQAPASLRCHPPHPDAAFLTPDNHLFSLAHFRHFLHSSGNATHSSSSYFALKSSFFTSMNMSFTSSWPCFRLFSHTLERMQTVLSLPPMVSSPRTNRLSHPMFLV